MSRAARWLDGFAAASARLGVRGPGGLGELLPPGAPLPPWWGAFATAPTREARAGALAPALLRARVGLDEARFRCG
ncbi:MAG TPA: hypothetical protein VFS43_06920 [Polyangiaceae bacterium]|nr:hypothetical protein [Polyangiaceae bacterium]